MAGFEPGNNLEKWRSYFRTCSGSDIFDIIENGILVAATDCPQEFKARRDRIAETLFSSKLTKCVGCDRVDLSVASEDRKVDEGSKESKVESFSDDRNGGMNVNKFENDYSYRDAEALTDELEEESRRFGEVLRIKDILENHNEATSLVFESLQRLELMPLSVEVLQVTEIGKAVKAVRKHPSTDIRNLANKLLRVWIALVDEWVETRKTIAGDLEGGTPESMNPSIVDEDERLPTPPYEDLAFFATHDSSMEFSQFFDGLEDELNPQNCEELNKNTESGRKARVERNNISKPRQQPLGGSGATPKFKKEELNKKDAEALMNKQATLVKPNKPPIVKSGFDRPAKPSLENKVLSEIKLQRKSDLTSQRPPIPKQKETKSSDEDKLEATKRKLQERYQEAQNAKRQRTIQVMELHDLPKQGLGHRNPHVRPGNRNGSHNRHGTIRRR
ncbi:probable mediator of RNA polymerase II transcription subunit 26b [Daucus carota subsp. sativus]|uniref:TFIIS N-terminal domain-containing protein n=1 Tax=Daucus carota subsp. sativus TaxID=79200 RepID=A0A162AFK0_DAUCS|nr:PREDICTED: probable mediator of RNA polymerase II transcription subunit 26b [Daucus carota subsp. sativus]